MKLYEKIVCYVDINFSLLLYCAYPDDIANIFAKDITAKKIVMFEISVRKFPRGFAVLLSPANFHENRYAKGQKERQNERGRTER